jgi:hypothetical protein
MNDTPGHHAIKREPRGMYCKQSWQTSPTIAAVDDLSLDFSQL